MIALMSVGTCAVLVASLRGAPVQLLVKSMAVIFNIYLSLVKYYIKVKILADYLLKFIFT